MSVVGQKEIRGDIWLVLDCGHMVRREAYEDRCPQCPTRLVAIGSPKPRKSKQRAKAKSKAKKPSFTPYRAPVKIKVPPAKKNVKSGEPFWWRGKLRKP